MMIPHTRLALIPLLLGIGILCAGCAREERLTTNSPEALRAYHDGVALYEKFYYREAKEGFEKAITADSGFAMAWMRRGVLSAELGNHEAAMKDLSRALRLSAVATQPEQLVIRMWDYWFSFQTGKAAAVADSLIEFYPRIREPYLVRGRLFEMEKKEQEAIAMYQRAIDMDTSFAQAVMSLGYAYSSMGEVDRACKTMERYIRLRPGDADPPASYGDVLLRTGRYEEALVQYRASLAIKPDYWYAYQRIGDIYAFLGRLTAAEAEYRKSFSLLPPESKSELREVLLVGRLGLLRACYAEAAENFRKGLAIDSVSGDAAYGLSYALSKMKEFKEADALIKGIQAELERRNLLASQAMVSFHLMRAMTLTEREEYAPALEAAREALAASVPALRVPIYIQIAEIYRRMGEVEPAFDACEEALALAPNMPEILLTLAKVYKEKGDREMTQKLAMGLWKTWKEADPDFHHLAELRKLSPPPRPGPRR